VDAGWNELVGCDEKLILAAVAAAQQPPQSRPKLYGDGQAAPRIARILTQYAADSADERRAAEALTL
jgi:UDP-N-acetylglucosamine 2-epimerase